MKLVLDASMALAWIFERNNSKEAASANRVLSALSDSETIVPMLWHTEITNALLVAERRKMITEAQVLDYLNRLTDLPIVTDSLMIATRRDLILALAREYNLTTYDATYLDLALRSNAILATFDNPLAAAMQKAGGEIF